ncbi:RHS repeat domain-containing protein [Hahella chejuensis]|nr:RHS repeat-associated core domain-containing protein [Hahella chejuensis]
MTNAEGEVVWSARYKAYGNLALKDVEDVQNPLRFQGQYYDEETGLHYNRRRYYDPSAARFINQDPVGLLGGDNNYQYALNPTGWVDPYGLTAKPGDCPKAEAVQPTAESSLPGGQCADVEIFYRAVCDKEWERMQKENNIVPRGVDYFVTQDKSYPLYLMYKSKPKTQKKYDHLIKLEVPAGTRSLLEEHGARAPNQPELSKFSSLPEFTNALSEKEKYIHLKSERGSLNYGLSPETKELFKPIKMTKIDSKKKNMNKLEFKNQIASCSFDDLRDISSPPQEVISSLIDSAIHDRNWGLVARLFYFCRENPKQIYMKYFCDILDNYKEEFHPEAVVDLISDLVEEPINDELLVQATTSLLNYIPYELNGDFNFNINIKCIDCLHWIATLDRPAGRIAKEGLIAAKNINNRVIREEVCDALNMLDEM